MVRLFLPPSSLIPHPPCSEKAFKLIRQGRNDEAASLLKSSLSALGASPDSERLSHLLPAGGHLPCPTSHPLSPAWGLRSVPSVTALTAVGQLYLGEGKVEMALQALQIAIRVDPKATLAHAMMGETLAQQGKTEEAISSLNRALKLDPGYGGAHVSHILLHVEAGNLRQAEEHVRRVHDILRTNPQARAQLLPRFEALSTFLSQMARVVALKDSNLPLAHQLGVLAAEITPKKREVQLFLVTLSVKLGRIAEAESRLGTLLAVNPSDFDACAALAKVLAGQGRNEEAMQLITRAQQLDPEKMGTLLGQDAEPFKF